MSDRPPMTCPQCSQRLSYRNIQQSRCWSCGTKICVPRTYYRPVVIGSIAIMLLTLLLTFSPPIFCNLPLCFVCCLMLLAVEYVCFCLGRFLWHRHEPPPCSTP